MSISGFLKSAYNYDFNNLNILECGAHEMGHETFDFRLNNNCFYIEAIPQLYNNLKNQPNLKQENVFNYALTDYNGVTEFNLAHGNLGNSSIKHSEAHLSELINYHKCNFEKIEVNCITYEHFIDNIIKKPIDILVLDIEGHECIILNSLKKLPIDKLPKFMVIEAGYDWIDRKKILKELGYNIDFYEYNNCYLTHSSFNIQKNADVINELNKKNQLFEFAGTLIFTNDALTL